MPTLYSNCVLYMYITAIQTTEDIFTHIYITVFNITDVIP